MVVKLELVDKKNTAHSDLTSRIDAWDLEKQKETNQMKMDMMLMHIDKELTYKNTGLISSAYIAGTGVGIACFIGFSGLFNHSEIVGGEFFLVVLSLFALIINLLRLDISPKYFKQLKVIKESIINIWDERHSNPIAMSNYIHVFGSRLTQLKNQYNYCGDFYLFGNI